MHKCPRCGAYTISYRRLIASDVVVCNNCSAPVRHRRSWKNGFVLLPLLPAVIFSKINNTGLVNELVVLGVALVLSLLWARRQAHLEVADE